MLDTNTRIGILAPITWAIPPKGYGPYERDVDLEIRGLLAAGYTNITLFATKQAQYPGVTTVSIIDEPFGETPVDEPHAWEQLHIANAIKYANEHNLDILHSHLNFYPVVMSEFSQVPLVTTLHSNGRETNEATVFTYHKDAPYISISNAVRKFLPDINWVGTVYNGVDFDQFSLNTQPQHYLVYAGRMRHEKGVHHAIELAKQTNTPLKLAGIVQPEWADYFETEIKPHLQEGVVEYLGNLGPAEVHTLISHAKAYVALNEFDEPFGNSIAEAMASGTPVIATPKGSHPELITDGVTGLLVKNVDEAVQRFREIESIDRAQCRATVENLYSLPVITQSHLAAFEQALSSWKELHKSLQSGPAQNT